MPMTAVPARMYLRSLFWKSQAQDRHRVVSVPLVTALVEPDSRYSLHDPRDPPTASPNPPAMPKPPRPRGKPGRPRKFRVKHRDKDDPENAKMSTSTTSTRRSADIHLSAFPLVSLDMPKATFARGRKRVRM